MSPAFPWAVADGPMDTERRAATERWLRRALSWQRTLTRWPASEPGVPDATPFVSLSANGHPRGCFGCGEGLPGERLARAFLTALHDPRFPPLRGFERAGLVAQVSYAFEPALVDTRDAQASFEVGTHGLVLLGADHAPAALLPDVARERSLDAPGVLAAVSQKAGGPPDAWRTGALWRFRTDSVVVRPSAQLPVAGAKAGLSWLSSLVDDDGRVAWAMDARTSALVRFGAARHARTALVLQALRTSPEHEATASRGLRWLSAEIERALAGEAVQDWPTDPARRAGAVALAVYAGAEALRPALQVLARDSALQKSAWHGAQVALALGRETPEVLWRACISDLDTTPWAPWTAYAARIRGDLDTFSRCARALLASIRESPPHVGGVLGPGVPELALTAVVIEALGPTEPATARVACGFLRRWQLAGEATPAWVDAPALGAFPASPVATFLRADVTAHCVLALANEPI